MRGDFVTIKRILIKTTSPNFRRNLLATRDRLLDLQARGKQAVGYTGYTPDFLVIGTQKGGTTELYDQLAGHPQLLPAFAKEVHYFDANYSKGLDWYSAFFPRLLKTRRDRDERFITGEATPCYLFHPHAAHRAQATLPCARIIMLLRNPVERAYSHYHHEVRLGYETLPFEEAIAQEPMRLQQEQEKMLADATYYSDPYMHYSYLARGIYIDQVKRWFAAYPAEQLLVLQSEDFFTHTEETMRQVVQFLGVADVGMVKLERYKTFPYPKLDNAMRQRLCEYFEPYNQQLYSYLGREFSWR